MRKIIMRRLRYSGPSSRSLCIAVLLGCSLLLSCRGRPRRADSEGPALSSSSEIAILNLRAGMPEGTLSDGLFPTPASQTYVGLVRRIERLSTEKKVSGVLLKLSSGVGFHRAEELGELIHTKAAQLP